MNLLPQFFHDSQTLLRRQLGIGQRIRLVGFLETAEDAGCFFHNSL
jgi:hypothetical protein